MSDRLHLRIDPSQGTPIYLQLIGQVKYLIARGDLVPDDELPSVRALAGQYLINPNTVARAYLELEREGLIYKKRGMGTYVAAAALQMAGDEKRRIVRELLARAVEEGLQLGLSPEELRQGLEDCLGHDGA